MKDLRITLIGILLVSGMFGTNNPLTAQTWLDRVREKSMDVWYGADKNYFTVDADGSWRKVKTKAQATHYRVSRQNRRGEIRGTVKFHDSSTDAIYWEGDVSSLDPLKPEGKVQTYHSNGNLWQEINYENGKYHGSYTEYDIWGGYKLRGTYADGLAHGLFEYGYAIDQASQVFIADQLVFEDFKMSYYYTLLGLDGFKALGRLKSNGDASLTNGSYQQAINYYSQILRKAPNLPIISSKRGEAYYRLGKAQEAKADLEKALVSGYSLNYWTYYLLGRTENELGSQYSALVHFFDALKTIPSTSNGRTLKGDIYHQMALAYSAKQDYNSASSYYKQAIEINPNAAYLHAEIARVSSQIASNDNAIYHATEALDLGIYDTNEKSDLLAIRGHANLKSGKWNAAERDARQALSLNQENPLARGLFLEVYPAVTYNSGGNFLSTLFITIALWEISAIRNLILAGRYWAAASEVVGNIIVGEGFEYVRNQINENSGKLIRSNSNKALDNINLSNHRVIKVDKPGSVGKDLNFYKDLYGFNYQGIFEVGNKSYFHMNKRIITNSAYEEHYSSSDPWKVFESFDNSKGVAGSKYFTHIDYINGQWHGVAKWHTEKVGAMLGVYPESPMEKIRNIHAKKYKVIDLDYGDGKWVVAYMKFEDRLFSYRRSQFIQAFYGFPEKAIQEYWKAGYYISTLKFIEDKWILVMTKYRGRSGYNFQQRLLLDNNFPEDLLKKHESQGYGVQSMTHGRNLYALVINKNL